MGPMLLVDVDSMIQNDPTWCLIQKQIARICFGNWRNWAFGDVWITFYPRNSTHPLGLILLPTSPNILLFPSFTSALDNTFKGVLQMERCARYPPAPQVIPILCSDQRYSVIWIDWAFQHSSHNCQPQPFSFVEFWTAATHLGGFRVLSASAPVQNHQASHLAPQVLGQCKSEGFLGPAMTKWHTTCITAQWIPEGHTPAVHKDSRTHLKRICDIPGIPKTHISLGHAIDQLSIPDL